MATEIIPQDLIIYRRILTDALAKITNEMYANNIKISYKYDFTIVPSTTKATLTINTVKPLYLFRVFAVDKSRNPIGETHYLYNNYYPKDIDTSVFKLERTAIQDWFTNASKALYNHIYDNYVLEQKEKQNLADSRKAEGITLENLKEQIKQEADNNIATQEQNIMKMLNPNL